MRRGSDQFFVSEPKLDQFRAGPWPCSIFLYRGVPAAISAKIRKDWCGTGVYPGDVQILLETIMKRLLGGMTFVLLAFANGPAAAYDYPWCAQYARSGAKNCGFVTFQQCRATVSGVGGQCVINPFYVAAQQERPVNKKPRQYIY